MRYRKKPVVVEVYHHRHNPESHTVSYPRWLVEAALHGKFWKNCDGSEFIRTLEGDMQVSDGDYIIRGIKGEIYPCKPDIFEATYEAVEVFTI